MVDRALGGRDSLVEHGHQASLAPLSMEYTGKLEIEVREEGDTGMKGNLAILVVDDEALEVIKKPWDRDDRILRIEGCVDSVDCG